MRAPLRVAVIGTGIGAAHLEAFAELRDLFEVAVVCDLDADRAAAAAASHGADAVTDFAQACARDDIDVVDVCTPPFLHVEQTLAALASGKHVVCEKPLAASLRGVDRLADAAQRAGKTLVPTFNYRFGRSFQSFMQLAATGQLGTPYLSCVEIGWNRPPAYYETPWRGRLATELGGCFTGHAIHHLDMLLAVHGAVERVWAATAVRVNEIETEDCAVAGLRFANGSLASLAVTLGSVEEYSRLRFMFAKASAEFGNAPYASATDGPWRMEASTCPSPP